MKGSIQEGRVMKGFTDMIKNTVTVGLLIFGLTSCGIFEDSEEGGTGSGARDKSFGQNGIVLGTFAAPETESPVRTSFIALRSDDQIIVGGTGGTDEALGFFYHRLSRTGAVLAASNSIPDSTIRINALALDESNNIVLAGSENTGTAKDFYRIRALSTDVIDDTFTAGTDDLSGSDDDAFGVAIRPSDGKIILGGYRTVGVKQFTLACYNIDGTRDTAFGTGGISEVSIGTEAVVRSVLLAQDGRIFALGESDAGGTKDFVLAKYYSTGTPDTSVGSGQGYVLLDYYDINSLQADQDENTTDDVLTAAAFQWGNYVIAVGSTVPVSGEGPKTPMLARFFTYNGSVDTFFGYRGRIKTVFSAYDAEAMAVAVQQDGKIVTAGYITNASGNTDFLVARYLASGILDPDFGNGGYITTNFGADINARATSAVIQPDGKIVAGGVLSDGRYAVVRYNP
jgi:uncharacterized delta-60 repeat protein